MKQYVHIVTAMECDWDCFPVNIGIFSTANLAIDWLNKNKTIIDIVKDDISPVEWVTERGSRKVFQAYGYDYPKSEVEQDEDGDYFKYCREYCEDEDDIHYPIREYKDYLNTKVSYTIKCFEVDRGV